MTLRLTAVAAFVALSVVGAAGQQSTIPPPTVRPPVPPVTTPVDPGRGAKPAPPARPGVPATRRIDSSIVVIGQVVDARDGRAVSQSVVRIAGPGVRQTCVSDIKGRFFFRDLPPGDFVVTVQKTGFIDGAFGRHRAGGAAMPITLVWGRWVSDLRIELFRQAAISGVVLDEANEPVVGTRVLAMQRQFVGGVWHDRPVGTDVTDDEGAYRLFGLTPGAYTVMTPMTQVSVSVGGMEAVATTGRSGRAIPATLQLIRPGTSGASSLLTSATFSANGRFVLWSDEPAPPLAADGGEEIYPRQYYPVADLRSLAMPVAIAPGEDRRGVDFRLQPVAATRITGRVEGPNGPVADELVRLLPADVDDPGSGGEVAASPTEPDGTFTFVRVPTGRYRVVVGTPPSVAAAISTASSSTVSSGRLQYWGSTPVDVQNDDIKDVVVDVKPGVAVSGILSFRPAPGSKNVPTGPQIARVALTLEAATGPARGFPVEVRVTPGGLFQAADLPPGDYFLHVESLPSGWHLDSIQSGGADGITAPLRLVPGLGRVVDVRLTERTTTLAGSARDARMRPVAGAAVLVIPASNGPDTPWNPNRVREARATTDGAFVIEGLPPGDYLAVALDDADTEGWQEETVLSQIRRLGTRVSLRAGDSKSVLLRISTVRR